MLGGPHGTLPPLRTRDEGVFSQTRRVPKKTTKNTFTGKIQLLLKNITAEGFGVITRITNCYYSLKNKQLRLSKKQRLNHTKKTFEFQVDKDMDTFAFNPPSKPDCLSDPPQRI